MGINRNDPVTILHVLFFFFFVIIKMLIGFCFFNCKFYIQTQLLNQMCTAVQRGDLCGEKITVFLESIILQSVSLFLMYVITFAALYITVFKHYSVLYFYVVVKAYLKSFSQLSFLFCGIAFLHYLCSFGNALDYTQDWDTEFWR